MILGQQIRLRPIEKDDLPRFVKWFSDPDVRYFLAAYRPFSQDQEDQWYLRNREAGDLQAWAIDAQPDDLTVGPWIHMGSCGFHEIDWRNRMGEVGIMIGARDFWGRGYGTDAMRTLVGWGFDMLNLHRLQLRVYADNARAIRCYEKVGFQHEGRLRESHYSNGFYRDTLLMSLLRSEWYAPPPAASTTTTLLPDA
jgi:RimJ/RimL family protein N-acetyltransferase